MTQISSYGFYNSTSEAGFCSYESEISRMYKRLVEILIEEWTTKEKLRELVERQSQQARETLETAIKCHCQIVEQAEKEMSKEVTSRIEQRNFTLETGNPLTEDFSYNDQSTKWSRESVIQDEVSQNGRSDSLVQSERILIHSWDDVAESAPTCKVNERPEITPGMRRWRAESEKQPEEKMIKKGHDMRMIDATWAQYEHRHTESTWKHQEEEQFLLEEGAIHEMTQMRLEERLCWEEEWAGLQEFLYHEKKLLLLEEEAQREQERAEDEEQEHMFQEEWLLQKEEEEQTYRDEWLIEARIERMRRKDEEFLALQEAQDAQDEASIYETEELVHLAEQDIYRLEGEDTELLACLAEEAEKDIREYELLCQEKAEEAEAAAALEYQTPRMHYFMDIERKKGERCCLIELLNWMERIKRNGRGLFIKGTSGRMREMSMSDRKIIASGIQVIGSILNEWDSYSS
ncbi:hypothetical protein FRC19_006470 [Serendipita sp. 401]|nr:hypothetical protein FRC19_006470 [Serendipita sp. 401]KAG9058521.1 hypothetical protein FS842_008818 [Serendipita sp. 407]